MFKAISKFAFCFSITLLVGCGGSGPTGTVTGKVTKDGKPVAAQVSFIGDTSSASGVSDASTGVYTLSSGDSQGVLAGKYKIAVSEISSDVDTSGADYAAMMSGGSTAAKPSSTIPAKYHSFGTSGLECTVTEGANTVDIDLE